MYEDRYNKDNHRNSYKNKDRNKNKDQHRDDCYGQIRGRSKEKEYSYDDRKDDSFEAKLKRVHKILQTMSKEKEIAIALMLVDSENLDHIVDSLHSQADVDHLIAERIECAKSQKAKKLTKDHHDNISITNSQSNMNPVNYEPINLDTGLTQHLQENVESIQSVSVATKNNDGKIYNYSIQHSVTSPHEENIQDIETYDIVEMPDICTRITDDQVIEEFMLEDEKDTDLTQESQEDFDFGDDVKIELIEGKVDNYYLEYPITYECREVDFQGMDKSKTTVKLQDIPVEVANEQELEECMQEEVVSDITLPEIYRVDEKIYTDVQLEIPIIKSEEGHIVQDEPKLVQDRTMICAILKPLQTNAQAQHMTEQKVSLPDRANIGKIIPITYVSKRESLRSEVVRKEIPTYIDSLCRPPSKPPDMQNSLEGEISKKILPYINPIYRPPLKPPNTQNTKGERKWIFRKKPYTKTACRPPPKPIYPFHCPSTISKKPYGEL